MELMEKQGFKHTELGMIPTDWIITELNSLVDKKRTIRYGIVQPGKYDPNGKFLIRGQDYSFGWVNPEDFFRVSPQIEEPYKNARVKRGDVIITIVGASTGKVEVIPSWLDQSNLTQTTARIAVDSNKGVNYYIKYYLEGKNGQEQVKNYIKGAAQPGLNCGDIEKFLTILPPTLTEQKAIATALSDVDDLISNLDKLISKKKAIKQGAMQQLLTPPQKGGKRLAGFSGEWEEKSIGKIGLTYGGLTGKSKKDFENGTHPYITFLNVMNNTVIDSSIFEFVKISSGEQQNQARKGDLFFNTSSETPEEVGMCAFLNEDVDNLYLNSFCFGFRLKDDCEVDGLFFSYLMNSSIGRKLFQSLAQGATRYNLSKSNFNKLLIEVPSPKEQKHIAQILSDMDLEIEQLATKKAKYQDIKQGMMQELLTGKTRLV